ncbi:hypothetical protein SAMN05661096_00081 [Marivirga sericea]|uniref:Uncharacterized protein n=1 Tax=Marivirga sericea TaxID=1028 RepID=A0A1X7I1Q3_9BACT|nr:hypothetical protein SAMN05661096_00081 [Marivirga sericea]
MEKDGLSHIEAILRDANTFMYFTTMSDIGRLRSVVDGFLFCTDLYKTARASQLVIKKSGYELGSSYHPWVQLFYFLSLT